MGPFDDDPVLRLLPDIDGLPSALWRLPRSEQRWRGRYYLMSWAMTQHTWFAWHAALVTDAWSVSRARRLVATIDDARIISEVERLIAAGKRP